MKSTGLTEFISAFRKTSKKNLKTEIRSLIKSRLIRNVTLVASGTAGAQVITMAFSPFITRLYGPEAFGLLGIFTALVAVIYPVAALSYPIAIVLPKHDKEAKHLAFLSGLLAIGIALIVLAIILLGGDSLINLLKVQKISSFILLIPLIIVFTAWLQIAQQWLIRKKQFKTTARASVLQVLLLNSAKVGIGLYNPVAAVLIVLTTAGNAVHALLLSIENLRTYKHGVKNWPGFKVLKNTAKKYYDFPLYRSPQIFLNSFSQSLPVLMLTTFFGPAEAGFYALCKKMLSMPTQLIGKSVGDVFYPRITEAAHNGENMTRLILKATMILAAVGLIPFAIIVAFGPFLFQFVFGNEWIVAGEYARWIALWIYFAFLNRPSVAAIPSLSIQKFFLIYEIVSIISRALSLYIGFQFFDSDISALQIFSLTGVLLNIFLITAVVLFSTRRTGIKNE